MPQLHPKGLSSQDAGQPEGSEHYICTMNFAQYRFLLLGGMSFRSICAAGKQGPYNKAAGRANKWKEAALTGSKGMPDADIWEELWLCHIKVPVFEGWHIGLGCGQQQVLQVGRAASQPVLQGLHLHNVAQNTHMPLQRLLS